MAVDGPLWAEDGSTIGTAAVPLVDASLRWHLLLRLGAHLGNACFREADRRMAVRFTEDRDAVGAT